MMGAAARRHTGGNGTEGCGVTQPLLGGGSWGRGDSDQGDPRVADMGDTAWR